MRKSKNIELYTYDGEKKDQIPIKYNYGDINLFNVASKYLLVVTVNNYFAVYDLERRGLKQTLSFRKFQKNGQSLGEIREAAINCKGNLIIFLTDNMVNSEMRMPETKIIICEKGEYLMIYGNLALKLEKDFTPPVIEQQHYWHFDIR